MGRRRTRVLDVGGLVLAAVVTGAAVLVSVPLVVGIGLGVAAYGVKVAVGARARRDPQLPALLRPRYGSPAATWLKRAEDAGRTLGVLARDADRSPTGDATRGAVQEAVQGAVEVLEDVRRVAGRSAAIAQALRTADSPGLDAEAARVTEQALLAPEDASVQQSATALTDRVQVRERLRVASASLDGRLQASALGLESLAARVAELAATVTAAGALDPSPAVLADLTAELDGLRVGLAEVDAAARRALGSTA